MTYKQCCVCERVREWMGAKSQGHICQRACTTTKCQLILLNDWQLPACGYSGRLWINAAGSEPPSYGPPLNIGHKKQPWISSGPGLPDWLHDPSLDNESEGVVHKLSDPNGVKQYPLHSNCPIILSCSGKFLDTSALQQLFGKWNRSHLYNNDLEQTERSFLARGK